MAVLLLPNLSALNEPYGKLLIAKVVGFTLVMGLAAANKWRLGPALALGGVPSARWFRRSVAAEYVLIAAVLAITAGKKSFFFPAAGQGGGAKGGVRGLASNMGNSVHRPHLDPGPRGRVFACAT